MNRPAVWWSTGAAFLVAFVYVGSAVTGKPPAGIDLFAKALRGQAVPLALFFTDLGLWYSIVIVTAVAVVYAIRLRDRLVLFALLPVSQIISQAVVAGFKPLAQRSRPGGAIGYALTDFSYPSGHAVTAVVFYGSLAALLLTSRRLPPAAQRVAVSVLLLCVIGIPWSRLALGAHYATDVIGGLCFGAAWFCLQVPIAVQLENLLQRRKQRW